MGDIGLIFNVVGYGEQKSALVEEIFQQSKGEEIPQTVRIIMHCLIKVVQQ